MEPVAAVVWVVVAVIAVGLLLWWWLGVHRRAKAEQAADILTARSGGSSYKREKGGGLSIASTADLNRNNMDLLGPPDSPQHPSHQAAESPEDFAERMRSRHT